VSPVRFAKAEVPGLYRRIGFDADLELRAFHCLGSLDLAACRSAFGRLVDGLNFEAIGPHRREASLLLLDVLQEVNRRLCRPFSNHRSYRLNRTRLLRQFAALEDPEDARRAFMPALNRLLSTVEPAKPATHHLVHAAQSFIEESYARRISLSSVASHLHVSGNYLSRVFKKETGTTLTSYIHGVRLEHALVLLAAGGRSISEIAYLVGYQNYRDFYRNFVKIKKASPRQFQRRLGPEPHEGEDISVEGATR
jgi:AraC-like DNA-binding protein